MFYNPKHLFCYNSVITKLGDNIFQNLSFQHITFKHGGLYCFPIIVAIPLGCQLYSLCTKVQIKKNSLVELSYFAEQSIELNHITLFIIEEKSQGNLIMEFF